MTIVLLDTVIASIRHPGKRNAQLRGMYTPHLPGKTLAISFQTVAELYLWAEQNKWGARRRSALEGYIRSFLVLPFDLDLARE